MLLDALKRVKKRFGFNLKAWVILPDHLHLMLKPGDADYSKVIFSLKKGLSLEFKKRGQLRQGDKLWQDRFWESMIKDDQHHEKCVDYIHFNPVKHGLVKAPIDWEHSSIHEYVSTRLIPVDWCAGYGIIIPGVEFETL
jgi:putative transposase